MFYFPDAIVVPLMLFGSYIFLRCLKTSFSSADVLSVTLKFECVALKGYKCGHVNAEQQHPHVAVCMHVVFVSRTSEECLHSLCLTAVFPAHPHTPFSSSAHV